MNRGSEWRKWDLHIHTPGTAKNDQYGNSEEIWEQYIEALEKTDIAVFGITDYFSINNYLKVKEYQRQGRLLGKFILPNVEMRLLPVTGKGTPVNIHAIFDPDLDVVDIEREFFRQLKFPYDGATYSCIGSDLIRLGRIVCNNQNLHEEAAIRKGIETFVISYDCLQNVVSNDFFKGRIIIALSNGSQDGVSGILKHDGDLQPLRKEITRMADIILSGNPSDIDYFLGNKTSVAEVIENYRNLKPCIIGSDAHRMDMIGVFPNDRITWVKADPTFEGLKQILFEPKERVHISDVKPDIKFDYNVIDHVLLNTASVWNQEISLNQNLNTIIGGRSTGKSTLLASIASKFKDIKDVENRDYIKELSDNVHVVWRDGKENDGKEIEYFTQSEIANIISKGDSDNLFCNILIGQPNFRETYEKFKEEEATRFSTIQSKVSLYFEKRRQYIEKSSYVKTLGDIDGICREIEKLEKERNAIQQKLTDKKEIIEKYQTKEKELSQLFANKTKLDKEKEQLDILSKSDFFVLNSNLSIQWLTESSVNRMKDEARQTLSKSNLHMQEFLIGIIASVDERIKNISKQIVEIESDASYKEGKHIFDENKNLVLIMKQISSLSQQKVKIGQESQILDNLYKEFKTIGSDLLNEHLSYLELMNSIASNLRIQHDNITLSASYELKPELEKTLNDTFSLRSVIMNQLITDTVNQYKKKTKEDIKKGVTELLNKAVKDELTFKNGYNVQSFLTNMLSTNWFKLKYNVDYESDNLLDMSPGKRSFVVLKLLLDFSDKKCPILIDQPEDNLDNRAIYNELVKYIREKKKERQIILVTHNPNIVVGADSEEVIVANQNGKNAPNDGGIKFQYVSGSLENSSKRLDESNMPILNRCGIREHVCDILEGGENAFRDRENKYGFFKI